MISPTRTLPDGYRQTDEIDLAKNKSLAVLLSLVAMVLFVLCFLLLGSFVGWARPELSTGTSVFTLDLFRILTFFAAIILTILVHEAIHGFFFWVFTRSQPVFALRLEYAYAAAPDWFIPVRQYWIIGLAPLLLIGALGLVLIFVASPGWIPMLVFLVALNTAGAVGDLFIVARLLRLSPGSLVKDAGDQMSFFELAKE
jgi:uncharacterized membrane protein (DUF485 family)